MVKQLCCQISSDILNLNELHKQYWWIPNETMIRPIQNILEDKKQFSNYILHNWMSFKDFILNTQFKYPVSIEDGHIYIESVKISEWNFQKSIFPYNIPNNVNHYVLWNSLYDYFHNFDESLINNILKENLKKIVDFDFNFVWYINPKPNITQLWHCQVFWIKI